MQLSGQEAAPARLSYTLRPTVPGRFDADDRTLSGTPTEAGTHR